MRVGQTRYSECNMLQHGIGGTSIVAYVVPCTLTALCEESLVGERAGTFGTAPDTGMALDAETGGEYGISRIDRSHGAERNAQAASVTQFYIHNGLSLQEHFWLAVESKRPVIRCVCIARNGDGAYVISHQLIIDPVTELFEFLQVFL